MASKNSKEVLIIINHWGNTNWSHTETSEQSHQTAKNRDLMTPALPSTVGRRGNAMPTITMTH